ncbi:MAG: TlpA family protein disulfide reductase [Salinivirgaceae bacterium]|nr:TlpA family protein disulfide reductase [Salinivirgaceae bacterium]
MKKLIIILISFILLCVGFIGIIFIDVMRDGELNNPIVAKLIFKYMQSKQLDTGSNYIDIPLTDINGDQHNLSEFIDGKWLMLDFSDYYCGVCHEICPFLEYSAQTYGGDINLVTISNDNKEDFTKFVEEESITWPAYHNQEAYSIYNIFARPTFIMISPEGKVKETFNGGSINWLLNTFSKYSESAKPQIEQYNDVTIINHPAIESNINGLIISKIDVYSDSTVLSLVPISRKFSISSRTALHCSDSSVCKAIYSSIGFDNSIDRKQNTSVKVTFESLPTNIEGFDYIDGDFRVMGVKVK